MKNQELSLEKLGYFIALAVLLLLFFLMNLYCHYSLKETASDLLSINLTKSIKIAGHLASRNQFDIIIAKLKLSQDNTVRLFNDARVKMYSALIFELFTPVLSAISI